MERGWATEGSRALRWQSLKIIYKINAESKIEALNKQREHVKRILLCCLFVLYFSKSQQPDSCPYQHPFQLPSQPVFLLLCFRKMAIKVNT
jgi:hypothetical protein